MFMKHWQPARLKSFEFTKRNQNQYNHINVYCRPSDFHKEEKVIVSMSCLQQLIASCIECGGETIYSLLPKQGSWLCFEILCKKCSHQWSWSSSKMIGTQYAMNTMISAAILFTGSSASKVLKFFSALNIAVISYSTFTRHQSTYLHGVS